MEKKLTSSEIENIRSQSLLSRFISIGLSLCGKKMPIKEKSPLNSIVLVPHGGSFVLPNFFGCDSLTFLCFLISEINFFSI